MILLALLLVSLESVELTRFVVDGEKGDDLNNGHNPSHAFKTIQHCIESLETPGDSCNIRAGRYHEELIVNGLRGTEKHPFYIRGYEDEKPVLDGSVVLEPSTWDYDEATGICSAPIDTDIFALFLNDDLLTAARWPNALWSDKSIFNNSFWGKCDTRSEYGNITDDGSLGLATSGINATGAMAILNIGSFNTYVRPVENHQPGSASFTYNHDMGTVHWVPRHNQYYFEASKELLDIPGEWFYEKESKVLYLIPPSGECPDPSDFMLRGRTTDYSITIQNTTHLTLSNMTFFASTVHAFSTDHKDLHIDEIELKSIDFKFASSSRRMLKDQSVPKWTKLKAYAKMDHGEEVFGKILVRNCTFEGGEGFALDFAGQDSVVENNLFLYNDWTGHDIGNGGTVYSQSHSQGDLFTRNTLINNGRSVGVRLGKKATIEFNEIIGQCNGEIQNDGAGIQVQNDPQNGVVITHNWVHDSPKSAVRFDGGGTHLGHNGYQGFNVVWKTGALMVKGDNHTVLNNLALDRHSEDGKCSLCVIYRLRHDTVIENNNTIVENNGATQADGGNNVDGGRWPMAGIKENNFSDKDIKSQIVDPTVKDFRPRPGGTLTSGPKIIGPYLPGIGDSTYWIPGRKLFKTSHPIPQDSHIVEANRDALMFLGGYLADNHHFYLGQSKEAVENADMDSPEFQYSVEQENLIALANLEPMTDYYWRVDAESSGLVFKGDVWKFSVKE